MIGREEAEQILAARALATGLSPENGEIKAFCTEDGEWLIVITRQGYRSALIKMPDYERHLVYPVFESTIVDSREDGYRVITKTRNNLVGAVGMLHKTNCEGYWIHEVSCEDYKFAKNPLWEKMPQTMIMRACEMGLIRMAYPNIFANTYGEDEIEEPRDTKNKLLEIIKTNQSIANEIGGASKPYNKMSVEELKEITNKIQEYKRANNVED